MITEQFGLGLFIGGLVGWLIGIRFMYWLIKEKEYL